LLAAWPTPDGGVAQHAPYWDIGSLAPNDPGQITLRVAVTLPLTNGTVLTNTAFMDSDQTITFLAVETTTVESAPILSLGKDDGVSVAYAGDLLTYTLTYTNSGNENEYDVVITDTLPGYIEYVGCEVQGGSCQLVEPGGDEVVFHIPTVIAQTGGRAWVIVRVNDPLPAGAVFVINHAKMTAPSLQAPIHVQDVDPIGTRPDLIMTVDHTPGLFSPGERMNYIVTYGNAGHMHAENVIITTTLPTNTVYVGPSGWYSSSGRTYTYTVGELPAGDTGHTITFTVEYTRSEPQQIGVTEFDTPFAIAGESSVGGDANHSDNTAYAYIGVPDLVVLDFTVEPLPLKPDVPVTFTIVLKNQGTGEARNPASGGGFWVDVFIAPAPSYPCETYSEKAIYDGVPVLAPGAEYTLVITRTGPFERPRKPIQFSREEIQDEIEMFYVRVDNDVSHPYGLVPESNEMNNLGMPISPQAGSHYIYLPLVVKRR